MINFFLALLGVVAVFSGLDVLADCKVYGKYLSEKELDAFFRHHPLENYETSPVVTRRMLFSIGRPYIARKRHSMFTRWNIEDKGLIPFWSKWDKKLEAYLTNNL